MQFDAQSFGASSVRPSLLLVEPYFVLRHTVALVAKELDLANVAEATSVEGAFQLLRSQAFDACVIAVGEERHELELVRKLRAGAMPRNLLTPVVITTAACDAGMVLALKELQIARIVLKPFKVKVILETISQIIKRPALLLQEAAAA